MPSSKAAPAPTTGKRKRVEPSAAQVDQYTVQVVTGSYERVLHGFTTTASFSSPKTSVDSRATFTDSFMFNAHTSAVRCLALSPESSAKRILASGGTDERVNLYQLSTQAPTASNDSSAASTLGLPTEAPRNKELGTLLNHAQAVTALSFPRHSKLLSASTDNNIAVTRTRDWQLLSTIHAPIPKTAGRPSGDTFAPGEVPAGINDLAVHPSARLALTVGIGERCMRLWNLVTGKKAGVLTFEKPLLSEIGESKYRGGEARRVVWRPDGDEFVVGFEKGLLVYGLDCQVRGVISLGLRGRVCQVRYVPAALELGEGNNSLLAVSTEDGRVIFYDTSSDESSTSSDDPDGKGDEVLMPHCQAIAQLGETRGSGNRIKDFEVIPAGEGYIVVTAGSDGSIHIWTLKASELQEASASSGSHTSKKSKSNGKSAPTQDTATMSTSTTQADVQLVGTLQGTSETNRRLTCMVAFLMSNDSGPSRVQPANGTVKKATQTRNGKSDLSKSDDHGDDDDEFGGFDD